MQFGLENTFLYTPVTFSIKLFRNTRIFDQLDFYQDHKYTIKRRKK